MVEYREFVDSMSEKIRGELTGALKDSLTEGHRVDKLQGASYYGLRILPAGSAMGFVLDLEREYGQLLMGDEEEQIVKQIVSRAEQAFGQRPELNTDMLTDFERMEPYLSLQAVSTEANAELLKKVPHREWFDLSAVCRFHMKTTAGRGEEDLGILLTEELLNSFGLTEEELFRKVFTAAPENFPLTMMSMAETLKKLCGDLQVPVEEMEESREMVIASGCPHSGGSGCLFYPDFTEKARERMGGSFYILPSSIHEVILLKADLLKADLLKAEENYSADFLLSMVMEVNRTEVSEQDRLSDHVYFYDADAGEYHML